MSNKIKVVGYAKKDVYTDGIEYRNFSPDLVGQQLTSNGGTPLMTLGNFAITTNIDPKLNKTYNTNKFSNFITLTNLDITLEEGKTLLSNNAEVFLNLDKTNLDYYALFGSLSEYIRVSLEDIIMKFPASLYLNPIAEDSVGQSIFGYTIQDYSYDNIVNKATFKVDTNYIVNKFELNYTTNGTIINSFSNTNDLRNVTVNYTAYSILYGDIEYPVTNFTGATSQTNDYIYLEVTGNPFSGSSTDQYVTYHIKPSKIYEDTYFNSLPDLQSHLLNRSTLPKYSAIFKYPVTSDDGLIMYITTTLTWPVSDGYNIDFDTEKYVDYVTSLLEVASLNDLTSSNLMTRFLVSESISAFDTMPVHLTDLTKDTSGQKVNKTLQVYGREFDELNKYIVGIEFANTVTYDKQDNTPDIYLKNIARVLGWDLISSVFENDLLADYVTTTQSTYSGESVGLTAVQADVELWKRIILNTPWIWKSKGTRKTIEFLLKFIGTPDGLIQFNEYVYKASGPIDTAQFLNVLRLNGLDDDLSAYPIDTNGYPRFLPDTPDMYFQNNGLWYRETGGTGATIDISSGNNPHVGPYDGGYKWFNQLVSLIPNFKPVTLSSETTTTATSNLYTNYDLGRFDNGVTTATTVNTVQITNQDGSDIDYCVVFEPSVSVDPNPSLVFNDCGCEIPDSDYVLSLCVKKSNVGPPICDTDIITTSVDGDGAIIFNYKQYDMNGDLFVNGSGIPIPNQSKYVSEQCCVFKGGTPVKYDFFVSGQLLNSGFVCCTTVDCVQRYNR